jgi:hypothetical protein
MKREARSLERGLFSLALKPLRFHSNDLLVVRINTQGTVKLLQRYHPISEIIEYDATSLEAIACSLDTPDDCMMCGS